MPLALCSISPPARRNHEARRTNQLQFLSRFRRDRTAVFPLSIFLPARESASYDTPDQRNHETYGEQSNHDVQSKPSRRIATVVSLFCRVTSTDLVDLAIAPQSSVQQLSERATLPHWFESKPQAPSHRRTETNPSLKVCGSLETLQP